MAVLSLACGLAQAQTATPTPCQTLTEAFDDIPTLSGWVQTNHSSPLGATNWFQGNSAKFSAQAGAAPAYIAADVNNTTGSSGTISNWLLTPPVLLQNGGTLIFWTRTVDTPFYPDRMQARMSTNGASSNVGTVATDVGDFTTLLVDINPLYQSTGYASVWTKYTLVLNGLSGPTTGRLAFRYFVQNAGSSGTRADYIGIDTVSYDPICTTPAPTILDVDASVTATKYDPLTDGLLVIRYLFGLTGTSLTAGALGGTATRTDPTAIGGYLDGIRTALDIDGNNTTDALTDGLLILRYMFGQRGPSLIAGAIGTGATRTAAGDIETYIQSLMP